MTRFARAKGSKSSNERAPEDSTPWDVMKEQLVQAKKDGEEAKKREQAEKQRIDNYESFLKDRKTQKRKATWCEFPDSQISILSSKGTSELPMKLKKQTNSSKSCSNQEKTDKQEGILHESKKSKVKGNLSTINTEISSNSILENKQIKKKNKKSKLNDSLVTQISEEKGNTIKLGQPDNENQNKKRKAFDKTKEMIKNNQNTKVNDTRGLQTQPPKLKKKKKLINGEPARRKPVNDNSFQLIINGKEVELVRFDGFPIMKKDAERLQELKSSMIKKGIPKSEVQRTLKLERRRAEKALARVKRDVCYNCRKGGHNLSDCPELKTKIPGVGAPDGLCFKCGSTEHRQFECKVQKDKEFRFATCFICKEPGHIARQCPDNPKGLYPNGGSCKLCGDVTHLRKDCPTVQDKREDSSIKLQTLDSGEPEGIQQKLSVTTSNEAVKKPKKIMF